MTEGSEAGAATGRGPLWDLVSTQPLLQPAAQRAQLHFCCLSRRVD